MACSRMSGNKHSISLSEKQYRYKEPVRILKNGIDTGDSTDTGKHTIFEKQYK